MNSSAWIVAWTALLSVAVVAVILSQHAQTASVIQALGQATSGAIGAAVAPVTQAQQNG